MERWAQSRKKRKRYRRQRSQAGEATADERPHCVGFGDNMPISPGDTRMIKQAMREGWNPSPAARRRVPKAIYEEFRNPDCPPHRKLEIARILIDMDASNREIDQLARQAILDQHGQQQED